MTKTQSASNEAKTILDTRIIELAFELMRGDGVIAKQDPFWNASCTAIQMLVLADQSGKRNPPFGFAYCQESGKDRRKKCRDFFVEYGVLLDENLREIGSSEEVAENICHWLTDLHIPHKKVGDSKILILQSKMRRVA